MKLVSRAHRVLALLMGVAVLATLVFQILKGGNRTEMNRIKTIQSKIK